MSSIPKAKLVNGKKTFTPLENNPEILTLLASNLGLKNLTFLELFSLDPILQDVPHPVHALIFIAPAPVYYAVRSSENHIFGPAAPSSTPPFPIQGPSQRVFWFKQTLGHACGLIALLHAVSNGLTESEQARILPDTNGPLATLLREAKDLDPEARARLLYDSAFLEEAHMDAAVKGSTAPPDPAEANGMHFIAFVKGGHDQGGGKGMLWDLEGGWSGPVPRCDLEDNEDVLSDKAIKEGPGRYLEVGREMGIAEFSCVAVCIE